MRRDDDGSTDHPAGPRRGGGVSPQGVLIAVAVIVLIVFAAANFKSVEVNFLLFTTQARVVTVILVAGLLGFIVGYLVGRPRRAERKRLRASDEEQGD